MFQKAFLLRFNSSMVRFGATPSPFMPDNFPLFQFQYGAIWSCRIYTIEEMKKIVSIPVWCDLEQAKLQRLRKDYKVSIPVWCDLEIVHININKVNYDVSIPVWCDLEQVLRFRKWCCRCVSIPVWCDLEHGSNCAGHCNICVSIPVWCDLELILLCSS